GERLLADLAASIVLRGVDLIVAGAAPAARAAKNATARIPIVMVGVGEPASMGLVASMEQPGGNVTGLSDFLPEFGERRLVVVKAIVPNLRRIAFVQNPAAPTAQQVAAAAAALGIAVELVNVSESADLGGAFAAVARSSPDALLVAPFPVTFAERARLIAFAAEQGLPAMFGYPEFVEDGGLAAVGASLTELYRRAAGYAARILRGEQTAEMAVERPERIEIAVNLRTARALGLTLPSTLVDEATMVVR
ncbi:MAG: ABC transporter substrate-binding protein, partial [Chloroflexi bacterium]|nr:ABC transporter substrate-binding protein [Chloroflexota bacterium]